MDFNLLKEFLNRDTTQKEFAKSKNAPCGVVWHKLRSEMNKLLHTEVIDAKSIICNTSRKTCDVRRNKESWLKAIKAYEKAMSNAYEKAMGEPVNFERDNRKISDLTVSEFAELLRSLKAI